ncbi:MAG: flagellar motor switch protein FliN [Vulcanimicrobiota bacterium]
MAYMPDGYYGDLSILNDVPLLVEAEMGRSNKSVREVLRWGEGSVVDFDKEAGDSVDLKVNGRVIARGEVVEIEGNYGVRITKLVYND